MQIGDWTIARIVWGFEEAWPQEIVDDVSGVENSNDFYIGRVVCKALQDPVGLSVLLCTLRLVRPLFIFSRKKVGVGAVSRGGGGFTVYAISRRSD